MVFAVKVCLVRLFRQVFIIIDFPCLNLISLILCIIMSKAVKKAIRKDVAVAANVAAADARPILKSAKKAAKKEARRAIKAQIALDDPDGRVSAQRSLKDKMLGLRYLACVVNPSPENAIGMPDDETTFPTGVAFYKETGILSTSGGSSEVEIAILPNINDCVWNSVGVCGWGISGTGSANFYAWSVYNSLNGGALFAGYRCVGMAIKVRIMQPALTATGRLVVAMEPGNRALASISTTVLSQYPGAQTSTVQQIMEAGGVFSFFLVNAPNTIRNSVFAAIEEPYDPRDFKNLSGLLTNTQPRIRFHADGLASAAGNLPQFELEIRAVFEFTTDSPVFAGLVGVGAARPSGPASILAADAAMASDEFNGTVDVGAPTRDGTPSVGSPAHALEAIAQPQYADKTSNYFENLKAGLKPIMGMSKHIWDAAGKAGSLALDAIPIGDVFDKTLKGLGAKATTWLNGLTKSWF